MKKRLTAILLTAVMGLSLAACGGKTATNMTATSRDRNSGDGTVYIADQELPLAGSIKSDSMTPEEAARADELRAMAKEALDLTNARRAERGLPALVWSDEIERCALIRASEEVTLFSHQRPDGSDWWTVNSDLLYGENLAMGYTDAASTVQAWVNSPAHADNLFGDFLSCGIAIYEAGGVLYVAQEFGY